MKKIWALALFLPPMLGARPSLAQAGGGAGGFGGNMGTSGYAGTASAYGSQERLSPEANERSKRRNASDEYVSYGGYGGADTRRGSAPAPAVFLEAGVLMNVKADEYVAVFGISEEAPTVAEASAKMEATLAGFKKSIAILGVRPEDGFVDFVAQVRIYSYKIEEKITTEELVGFELKKNISIRFKDKELLDKLSEAASRERIYDLIKVDYVVRDTAGIQEKLQAEAARIVARKALMHQSLPGASRLGAALVVSDKPSIYYPTEQYSSYTAAESEELRIVVSEGRPVRRARKGRTFYFNPLTPNLFDKVINPVIIEPVVQFTAYLRVKYELAKK